VTSDLDEANLTNMVEDGGGVAVLEDADDEDVQELMRNDLIPGSGENGEMGEGELEGFQPWTAEDESSS
jgi:hypothetical protein